MEMVSPSSSAGCWLMYWSVLSQAALLAAVRAASTTRISETRSASLVDELTTEEHLHAPPVNQTPSISSCW